MRSIGATGLSRPARVFVSYARVDAAYRDALLAHLATLRTNGLISDWQDGEIVPGEEWDAKIRKQLDAADIIVLLLSASFFDSDYINRFEIPHALERHEAGSARVVPVVVRAVEWKHTPLARIQGLPDNGKAVRSWADPDEAWANVAAGIRRVVEALEPKPAAPPAAAPATAVSSPPPPAETGGVSINHLEMVGSESGATVAREQVYPPLQWIDREHVRNSETAEVQMQIILSVPPDGLDLDVGEINAALFQLTQNGTCGPVIKTLLTQPSSSLSGSSRIWKYHRRIFANVVQKWELETENRGLLIYKWAEFRDGTMRLFNTVQLIHGIVQPVSVYRMLIEAAVKSAGIVMPSQSAARVVFHASGPILLHDEIQIAESSMFSNPQAPPKWSVDLISDWTTETIPIAFRLINRVLGRFSDETSASPPVQLRKEALLRVLGYKPSTNPLDILGAKKL